MSVTPRVAAMRPRRWLAELSEGIPCPFECLVAPCIDSGRCRWPMRVRRINAGPAGFGEYRDVDLCKSVRAVPAGSIPHGPRCCNGADGRNGKPGPFGKVPSGTGEQPCENFRLHRSANRRIYASPKFARARGRPWSVEETLLKGPLPDNPPRGGAVSSGRLKATT